MPTLQVATGEARQFIRRPLSTTITADTPAGATTIPVASTNNIEVDSEIVIGSGDSAQRRTVVAFAPNAGTATAPEPSRSTRHSTAPVFRSAAAQPGPPRSRQCPRPP